MVDIFALALPHALLVLALFRIMTRDDLDAEDEAQAQGDGPPAPDDGRAKVRRGVRVS